VGNAALSGAGVPALREWGTRHRSGHAAQRRIRGKMKYDQKNNASQWPLIFNGYQIARFEQYK